MHFCALEGESNALNASIDLTLYQIIGGRNSVELYRVLLNSFFFGDYTPGMGLSYPPRLFIFHSTILGHSPHDRSGYQIQVVPTLSFFSVHLYIALKNNG